MSRYRRLTAIITQLALVAAFAFASPKDPNNGGRDLIRAEELKEWLTYFASDELEGRNTFSEGLGLAAGYLAGQLKSWSVRPGGPNGSYFQRVVVLGVKSENRSSVTVETGGQSRTFKNRDGVSFPANVGGKRTFTADGVEFLGYGLSAPAAGHDDYANKDVRNKVVVYIGGPRGPKGIDARYQRLMFGRARNAIDQYKAVASIGPGFIPGQSQRSAPQDGINQIENPDFTTAQRLDATIPPIVSAADEFFEFLFSSADVKYAELKDKAAKGEPLPTFTLKNVRITFNIDADYRVVRTQYTRNVVGIVEGRDPKLKDTYVAFGAHYDHVGYSEGEIVESPNGSRRIAPRGRVTQGAVEDRIWNGADDDGSGSVTILAIAKAFARGPKPRRSVVFVWHAGEERGLWGSRYFADYPTVPLDRIVAQINMDMVGRSFDNRPDYANSVFVVGSDRISTELHNITIDANQAIAKPLKLDFDMNDLSDLEQIYYRSDHYSYAAKGIPIVFLFTGIHPDYHANTDHADKIDYEKMARIGQFAYEIGSRVANLDHAPVRDNRGPRAGRGSSGKL